MKSSLLQFLNVFTTTHAKEACRVETTRKNNKASFCRVLTENVRLPLALLACPHFGRLDSHIERSTYLKASIFIPPEDMA
jgi:hypothetical protein